MNLFLGPRWTKMRNCLAHFAYNGRQLLNLNNLRAGKPPQEPCHFTSEVQIENCWNQAGRLGKLPDVCFIMGPQKTSGVVYAEDTNGHHRSRA